jgi:hypothetical protein
VLSHSLQLSLHQHMVMAGDITADMATIMDGVAATTMVGVIIVIGDLSRSNHATAAAFLLFLTCACFSWG